MVWIIDAYNLLFHDCWSPRGLTLEQQREHLINEIAFFRQRDGFNRTILVFDGKRGIGPYDQRSFRHGIEIIYAVCSGKADARISELACDLNGVCVVTADRRLKRDVRRYRAAVMTPPIFMRHWRTVVRTTEPTPQEKPTPPTDSQEVEEWLDTFGLEPEIEIEDDDIEDDDWF